MKFYENNPRQITHKQFGQLSQDLEDYGDLGSIVHDLNSDQIISANQRCRVFDLSKIEPVVVEKFTKPNKQGTVARGYVKWKGERFAYRQVRWTEDQCQAANIKANLDGGSWDFDTLANWDSDILQGFGFDEDLLKGWQRDTFALGDLLASEDGGEIEHITVGRLGQLYRHDIEPFKLAYRVEAIWRARGGKAIDLFSGEGQLAEWYKRRFITVITIDKRANNVDYQMTASNFIDKMLLDHLDFDFIDFDDEGTPARELAKFFRVISGKKKDDFIMALTDGQGLNLKIRGSMTQQCIC